MGTRLDVRRRLPSVEFLEDRIFLNSERLAAIPLTGAEISANPQPEIEPGTTFGTSPLPVVGAVSSVLCMAGCLVRRYFRQLKPEQQQQPTSERLRTPRPNCK